MPRLCQHVRKRREPDLVHHAARHVVVDLAGSNGGPHHSGVDLTLLSAEDLPADHHHDRNQFTGPDALLECLYARHLAVFKKRIHLGLDLDHMERAFRLLACAERGFVLPPLRSVCELPHIAAPPLPAEVLAHHYFVFRKPEIALVVRQNHASGVEINLTVVWTYAVVGAELVLRNRVERISPLRIGVAEICARWINRDGVEIVNAPERDAPVERRTVFVLDMDSIIAASDSHRHVIGGLAGNCGARLTLNVAIQPGSNISCSGVGALRDGHKVHRSLVDSNRVDDDLNRWRYEINRSEERRVGKEGRSRWSP